MKTLYLLRHAKSSWGDKHLDDHDRPLNARGRDAAPRIGAYLREKGLIPTLILCSTAQRARETLGAMLPFLPEDIEVQFSRGLYLASPEAMLAGLRADGAAAGSVMVIGHNPGMEQLALGLARHGGDAGERERRKLLKLKFPTACLAVLRFDVDDWDAVRTGTGVLEAFVQPKDLGGEDAD